MARRITQPQLESYLWGAAVLLRGTIDAGDYKQFIFPLLFYKRLCDVFDEETQTALAESGGDRQFSLFPENHRFQIPPKAHWHEVRQVATDVGRTLQNALRGIETANPDKLYGIFGDAQWTNKDRLSDAMLRDLVEHFSTLELTIANLPEDELGQGYEYLIKKFADDSGHTAAEFYTNRTVVHLMTKMLQPQPGESVYDPTCGSGGMLLSAIAHLRRQGQEWRNVRLHGQERNLMTSAIARMNCFLHGIEDFRIERGDTLAEPKFVEGDRLCASMWCWPIRHTPSSSGTVTPSLLIRGGAISTAPRRRAGPTMPSGSTSCRVWCPRPAAVPFCFRTACSSARRRPTCDVSSSRPTSSSASSAWAEPLLQLAHGSLRRHLPHRQGEAAPPQDSVHQRCERGHPRARPELPD
jgi:N-6 DNA Methylase/HsdM N-terminal domain